MTEAEKKHALISPSAFHRIGYCPAAVLLSQGIEDEGSAYASEGTTAHRLAELTLRQAEHADDPVFQTEMDDAKRQAEQYEGMASFVDSYVSYVDGIRTSNGRVFSAVEYRIPLTPITGEPDAFGTADFVAVTDNGATLHVADLKYGMGVEVSAKENVQLSIYALGLLEALDPDGLIYGIDKVVLHVCQVRLRAPDVWQAKRAAFDNFRRNVREASDRARYLVDHPDELIVAAPFVMKDGTHNGDFCAVNESEAACRFCKAKAKCPMLTRRTGEALAQDFEDLPAAASPQAELAPTVAEELKEIPVPDTPERLGKAFAYLPLIESWCDAVRASALRRLEAGEAVPGLKLVAGRPGPRKWTSEAEAVKALDGYLTKAEAYDFKIISPTKAEKLMKAGKIGEQKWKKLQSLISRSEPKPAVATEADPREAIAPQIEHDFE